MQAIHHLVDCAGKTLASPFQPLRAEMGEGLSETALIDCAVNKLGYVHVQEMSRGLVVSYNKSATTPVALVGAIYLLADLQDKRAIFSTPPNYSLCRNRSEAIGRLVDEMHRVETHTSSYRVAPSALTLALAEEDHLMLLECELSVYLSTRRIREQEARVKRLRTLGLEGQGALLLKVLQLSHSLLLRSCSRRLEAAGIQVPPGSLLRSPVLVAVG